MWGMFGFGRRSKGHRRRRVGFESVVKSIRSIGKA